jgi:hypothetical protein
MASMAHKCKWAMWRTTRFWAFGLLVHLIADDCNGRRRNIMVVVAVVVVVVGYCCLLMRMWNPRGL